MLWETRPACRVHVGDFVMLDETEGWHTRHVREVVFYPDGMVGIRYDDCGWIRSRVLPFDRPVEVCASRQVDTG